MSTPPGRPDIRRALGSWMEAPPRYRTDYPGQALGWPETGRGSVAGYAEKLIALLVDLAVASAIGLLIARPGTVAQETRWNVTSVVVFVVLTALSLMASGRTPGMRAMGLQVIRLDGHPVGPRALLRQLMVAVLIPALLANRDRRGVHDRLCATAVVRVR